MSSERIIQKYGRKWDTSCIENRCYEKYVNENRKENDMNDKHHNKSNNTKTSTIVLDLDETLIHTFENQQKIDTFLFENYPKIYNYITNPIGTCIVSTARLSKKDKKYFHIQDNKNIELHNNQTSQNTVSHETKLSDCVSILEHEEYCNNNLCHDNELSLIRRLFTFELDNKRYWAIKRPYLDTFFDYIFEKYNKVILWSAGSHDYVHKVCEVIFDKHTPYKIYTRDDCETKHGSKSHKPLSKIQEDDKHLENIFLVDNLPENSTSNNKNHFYIPDYDPEQPKLSKYTLETIDTALLKTMEFMEENTDVDDVKKVLHKTKDIYKHNEHIIDYL